MGDTGPRCWPCWSARRVWVPALCRIVAGNGEVILMCAPCTMTLMQVSIERPELAPRRIDDLGSPDIKYKVG